MYMNPTERMAEIDSLLQMMSIGVISHNNHELEYFRKNVYEISR